MQFSESRGPDRRAARRFPPKPAETPHIRSHAVYDPTAFRILSRLGSESQTRKPGEYTYRPNLVKSKKLPITPIDPSVIPVCLIGSTAFCPATIESSGLSIVVSNVPAPR